MKHGTTYSYRRGCRCEACRDANRRCHARWIGHVDVDREALRDLLAELCPDGLTDDCPARRSKVAA